MKKPNLGMTIWTLERLLAEMAMKGDLTPKAVGLALFGAMVLKRMGKLTIPEVDDPSIAGREDAALDDALEILDNAVGGSLPDFLAQAEEAASK